MLLIAHHSFCTRHLAENLYGETTNNLAREYVLAESDNLISLTFITMTVFQSECQQSQVRLVRAIDSKQCSSAYFTGKNYVTDQ